MDEARAGGSARPYARKSGELPLRRTLATGALALAVVAIGIAVHAPVLRYPFIQDDWYFLNYVLTGGSWRMLAGEFSPYDRLFYRPLGSAYFVVIAEVLNSSAFITHLVALTLHTGASLLVFDVIRRLTRSVLVGWLSALLYASAASVHMDPLLWASGIVDNASVCLALVSIRCFVAGRMAWSAVAYGVALLFKESVWFLPLVFAAVPRLGADNSTEPRTGTRWRARRLGPICVVAALWVVIKILGMSPLVLPGGHPYAIRLTGSHVGQNVATYCRWVIEALFPTASVSASLAVCLVALLGGLLIGERLWTRRQAVSPVAVAPLVVWFSSAILVYVFLPNHAYRYYLTSVLPAAGALVILSLRAAMTMMRIPHHAAVVVLITMAGASVISSFVHFWRIDARGLDQAYVEGTNDLVRRGATVVAVRAGLLKAYPTLPRHAVLLFRGVIVEAFDHHSGPRVWYRDPSLRAYDASELREESGRWFLLNPVEDQDRSTGSGASPPLALDCCPTFLFEMTSQGLVERRWPIR